MFWVLKRTVTSRRFLDMFWLRNKKNNFQLRTLIWGHAFKVNHQIAATYCTVICLSVCGGKFHQIQGQFGIVNSLHQGQCSVVI